MKIIFLGAPGSGKGTVAFKLAQEFGFFQLSPGNLFRQAVKDETALGKEVKSILDKGELVPNEITNELVKQNVKEKTIFDGYPRTIEQAQALDSYTKVDRVVFFDIKEETVVSRLSGRRVCPVCQTVYHIESLPPKEEGVCDNDGAKLILRDDDKPEVVKQRFRVYKESTVPLVERYKEVLLQTDASLTPDEVYKDVVKLLGLK